MHSMSGGGGVAQTTVFPPMPAVRASSQLYHGPHRLLPEEHEGFVTIRAHRIPV